MVYTSHLLFYYFSFQLSCTKKLIFPAYMIKTDLFLWESLLLTPVFLSCKEASRVPLPFLFPVEENGCGWKKTDRSPLKILSAASQFQGVKISPDLNFWIVYSFQLAREVVWSKFLIDAVILHTSHELVGALASSYTFAALGVCARL